MLQQSLVLSKTLVMLFVFFLTSQASSLASSILLIPSSVLLMISLKMEIPFSGMLTFMFLMVFIGGLMILLVSVASVVYQEQWVTPGVLMIMAACILGVSFIEEAHEWEETSITFMTWFSSRGYKSMLLFTSLLILLSSLMVISWFLMNFKGMMRSM